MSDAKGDKRSIMQSLEQDLETGRQFLSKPPIEPGKLAYWTRVVRHDLEQILGSNSPLLSDLPEPRIDRVSDPAIELARRMHVVRRIIETLQSTPHTPMR